MKEGIPRGWAETTLGEVLAKITGGGTPSKNNTSYFSGHIPFMTVKDMKVFSPNDTQDHITVGAVSNSSTKIIPADSLIIATRIGLGKVVRCDFETAINQDLKALVPGSGVDKDFLARWLQNRAEYIKSLGKGTTVKGITLKVLSELRLNLPPTNEQHRIVKKIDALMERSNQAKEALDAIPNLLGQYMQSVLASAFRGDLTSNWRETNGNLAPIEDAIDQLRMQRLGNTRTSSETAKITTIYDTPEERASSNLPNGWAYIRLEKLAPTPNYGTSKKSSPSGKIPVLRMGNIQNGELDWTRLVFTSDFAEIEKYSLISGDVLFNRTNSPELVGKTAVYHGDRPAIYAGYLIRIRPFDELNPEFLAFFLNSPIGRDYCRRVKSDGVSQSNINAKKLTAFEVPLCSKDEQEVIVHRIKSLFSVIENVRLLVNEAHRNNTVLTNSILAKAFRGKLVPQNPTDEPASILLKRIRAERDEHEKTKAMAKKKGRKKMDKQKRTSKIITIVDALKQANSPLSAQDLLVRAGYPNDVATEQLELFFLDVREQLNEGTILRSRKGDEDIFALAG